MIQNNNTKTKDSSLNTILSGTFISNQHILFLYSSYINKQLIQSSFFSTLSINEKSAYITSEEKEEVIKRFDSNLIVIHPDNIDLISNFENFRIIVDMSFIEKGHDELEEYFHKNKKNTVLCMYNISKLKPEKLQKLASCHDRLILNTPETTVLSGEMFNKKEMQDAVIERFVKDYLDIVVLALIAEKPRCGTDILEIVHKKFNVFLSPGTIYPLLHKLKKEGLLECECGIKKKVYKPARGSKENIKNILDEHFLANKYLNDFLKSKIIEGHTT